jgi:TolB-like protein
MQSPSKGVASVAVLPFANRSGSPDDEYFSDGLADELINMLAKIRGLKVAARSSAFQFKGKSEDLAVVARKLNVATVLDGSVRKAGNRVRVAVQLVNVADGSHLWSERYDRTLDDIFAVQDDIAKSVVKELRSALLGEADDSDASSQIRADVARAAGGRGHNPEAHRLLLQGRYFIDRGSRADVDRGIAFLKSSLELDGESASAWAALAHAYTFGGDRGWMAVAEAYELARNAAARAVSLDARSAEGHATLAWIQAVRDHDWAAADASCRRALQLDPNNAVMLRRICLNVAAAGRPAEGMALARKAVDLDPLNPLAWHILGRVAFIADLPDEAVAAYRQAVALAPQIDATRGYLAVALHALGRLDEALDEASREPAVWARSWAKAITLNSMGRRAEAEAALAELQDHGSGPFQVAEVYACWNDPDRAFEWLERAYEQPDPGFTGSRASPLLRSLHGDPRWQTILKKLRFID